MHNSVRLKYAPKRSHFTHAGMVARNMLAVIDHNENVCREAAMIDGNFIFSINFGICFCSHVLILLVYFDLKY